MFGEKGMKKLSALIALSALTASVMILQSCGGTGTADGGGVTAAADAGTSSEPSYIDDLPADLDFGGETVNILCWADGHAKEIYPPQSGDVVDDALFERCVNVEERLDLRLVTTPLNIEFTDYLGAVKKILLSDENAYDAIYMWQYDFAPLAVDGFFLDLSDAPYLDLTKPWWAVDYMKSVSVNGDRAYFLFGDYTVSMLGKTTCFMFNKDMYADVAGDPNGLYGTVLDGVWTYDRLLSVMNGYYSDVNGDGVKDKGDRYGMTFSSGASTVEYMIMSMEGSFSSRDENGLPVLTGATERVVNAIDRVIALTQTDNFYFGKDDPIGTDNAFVAGQLGFVAGDIEDADYFRKMEDEFGVIPYPKYDESQKSYITNVHDMVMMTALPANCAKVEAVCAAFEAMCSEGYRSVAPAYYEIALKTKYIRDDISCQVLDLLHDTRYADFAYVYNYGLESVVTITRNMVDRGSNNYTSWFARNESRLKGKVDKMIQKAAST